MSEAETRDGPVTIVTQTRVLPGFEEAFAVWQEQTSALIADRPHFLGQTLMRPSPPAQVDWVILQRFASSEAAIGWLNSSERLERIRGAQSMLIGRDDVHLVRDGTSGVLPAPVSAVIATRVKPGGEAAYRAWEQRIAAAQCRAPGFQGYRFEPPVPGVQDDWLSILRFDSEENLERWLNSPQRLALLEEVEPFVEEFHARIARSGFDQWFPAGQPGASASPVWKQNMIVLLMLYPVVYLFGLFVQTPLLTGWAGLAFPAALFVGNLASVALLNYLVPWASGRFGWWLAPPRPSRSVDMRGAIAIAALYAALIIVFTLTA